MPRLTIFAKGNSDVSDALFACQGPTGRWDGANEALRTLGADWRVRLRHETCIRTDALLQTSTPPPAALCELPLPWPYTAESQFSDAFFESSAEAYVLSIQPDVTMKLVRHIASGRLFYPGPPAATPPAFKAWLRRECEIAPLLSPEDSLANFQAIVARLRARCAAPVLVFNLSTVIPGDQLATVEGAAETLAMRIKRFNLAADELSRTPGVFVVDVDRVVAKAGADRLKLDAVRLNVEGSRIVAGEVLRLLDGAGVMDLELRTSRGSQSASMPPPIYGGSAPTLA